MTERFYVRCACSCSALEVELDSEIPSYDISLWLHGYTGHRLRWYDRVRWCWRILRTGRPWTDQITISVEDAHELHNWLRGTLDARRPEGNK